MRKREILDLMVDLYNVRQKDWRNHLTRQEIDEVLKVFREVFLISVARNEEFVYRGILEKTQEIMLNPNDENGIRNSVDPRDSKKRKLKVKPRYKVDIGLVWGLIEDIKKIEVKDCFVQQRLEELKKAKEEQKVDGEENKEIK